jgi:hypothetical protein
MMFFKNSLDCELESGLTTGAVDMTGAHIS